MNKIRYILCLIFVSTAGIIFSQEDNNWVQGKVIVDVEFEGLKNVDKSELNGVVTPYIGKEFTDELFLELQTIMYELDYFEFIVPNAKPGDSTRSTVILVFQVQESPTISKILFQGNDSVWKSELFSTILVKAKDIYSDFKVEMAQKDILELYKSKGFSNPVVDIVKESKPEDNSLVITFKIDEGVQTLIRAINFNGNNIFATDNKLRSLIDTKQKSLFKDGVYNEAVIQSDILKIESIYHNSGYVKARVIDVKTTLVDDENKENVKNMTVDFFIEEGDVYTYGGIEYTGNEIYKDVDFDKLELLKFGEVYDQSKHERRFVNLQSLYYDNGYIENSFNDHKVLDEENKIISHEISVIERGVAHIGTIAVSGNTKTKDIVILREIQIKPGDVFSRQKVWESMSNIMSTSLFTNTIPQLNKSEEGNMDLLFEVEEARTLNLMGGITVSGADFEPALTFSLKDLNFMGMGRTLGGTLTLGMETQSFSLEFNEPRIFNTEYFGGISLAFTHSVDNFLQLGGVDDGTDGNGNLGEEFPLLDGVSSYAEYEAWVSDGNDISTTEEIMTIWDISFALSGGHLWYSPLGRVRASGGYTTSADQYVYNEDVTPFDEDYRDKALGEWLFSDRIWVRGVLDARDTPIGTTKGYGFSQNLTLGGIIPLNSESNYIKSITNGDVYFKLIDTPVTEEFDLVLSLRLHAAYTRIFNKPGMKLVEDDKTAAIDGMFVGRGWQVEDGGVALLDIKAELNVPLAPGVLGMSLFFDGANVWTGDENVATLKLDDFKFSFGASLGITNQIMPISFFIAKTFYTDNGSVVWEPEKEHSKIFWGNATWGISFNMNYLLQ